MDRRSLQPNLGRFDRGVRFGLGAFALFAAAFLFANPVARLAAAAIGALLFWEGAVAYCPLHSHLGIRDPGQRLPPAVRYLVGLLGIQVVVGYAWASAGAQKIADPRFLIDMPRMLGSIAMRNPFGWYRDLLIDVGVKYAQFFGSVIAWGQLFTGLALAGAAVLLIYAKNERQWRLALLASVIACAAGMLMNANFYVAAGWTDPTIEGMNVLMFWAQALLGYVWLQELLAAKS